MHGTAMLSANDTITIYRSMLQYKIERADDIMLGIATPTGRKNAETQGNQDDERLDESELARGRQKTHAPITKNQTFDFMNDIEFQDLKDIRDIYSYRNKINRTIEEQSITRDKNPWSYYTKEFKTKILRNVGVLMGLQLRNIVQSSMEDAQKFFLSFPTYKTWLRS